MILLIVKRCMPGDHAGFVDADITASGYQLKRRIAEHLPARHDAIQPASVTAILHQRCHIGNAEVEVKLEAWRARLRHLDQRLAPAEDVADIHVLLRQPDGREILAKRRRDKQCRLVREIPRPLGVMLTGIVA